MVSQNGTMVTCRTLDVGSRQTALCPHWVSIDIWLEDSHGRKSIVGGSDLRCLLCPSRENSNRDKIKNFVNPAAALPATLPHTGTRNFKSFLVRFFKNEHTPLHVPSPPLLLRHSCRQGWHWAAAGAGFDDAADAGGGLAGDDEGDVAP